MELYELFGVTFMYLAIFVFSAIMILASILPLITSTGNNSHGC